MVGSSEVAFKETEPQRSGEGESDSDTGGGDSGRRSSETDKERGDGDKQNEYTGQETGKTTSATGTRHSSKRTARTAGLDEGDDGKQSFERPENRRTVQVSSTKSRNSLLLHDHVFAGSSKAVGKSHANAAKTEPVQVHLVRLAAVPVSINNTFPSSS